MAHFIGKFQYTIDEKGRINIPARFRKSLSPQANETFVIAEGTKGGLSVYPSDEWENVVRRINRLPESPETETFRRFLFDTSSDSTLDRQGRIRLTPQQIAFAGLQKEVIIVGDIDKIRVWDPERYRNAFEDPRKDVSFDEYYYNSMQIVSKKLNDGD